MKFLSIFFAASLIFISCKNQISGYHLPPKVMKKLLLDIHMAESYCSFTKDTVYKAGMKNLDSLSVYYKDILAHYKITTEQFSENMEWYQNHPDDLDTIYTEMITIATTLQTTIPKTTINKGVGADSVIKPETPAPKTPVTKGASPNIPNPKTTAPIPQKDRGTATSPH